ncbi:hypothetical protein V8C42DRAFT_340081 [Trichoderma barbatum]
MSLVTSLPLHPRFTLQSFRPEMHGMPDTIRATPPLPSICGWIALTASTCGTENVRDKELGAGGQAQPASHFAASFLLLAVVGSSALLCALLCLTLELPVRVPVPVRVP